MRDFAIGEKVEILIGEDITNYKCSSIHCEKMSNKLGITERKYFGFDGNDGTRLSISWEVKDEKCD